MKIAISEAKTRLSALVNAALAGKEVILTKHGRPVAEIRPFATAKRPAEKLSAIRRIVIKARSKRLSGVSAAKADNFYTTIPDCPHDFC